MSLRERISQIERRLIPARPQPIILVDVVGLSEAEAKAREAEAERQNPGSLLVIVSCPHWGA